MNETGNEASSVTVVLPGAEGIVLRGAAAMQAKRRELIAQPLDRIWPDLMRAAIEAMREPTPDMLGAGFLADEDDRLNHGEGSEPIEASFKAMIDAALKVQP